MSADIQHQDIIINSSGTPVLRSGFSNLIFVLLAIMLVFANQILNEFYITLLPKTVIFLIIIIVAFKIYGHSISRLTLKNGQKIVMVGPISKATIDISEIERAQVSGIPSSMIIFIELKMKNARLPKWYFFVAFSTNCGSYNDTKAKLVELLEMKKGELNS
ncbi:MAG: hypothetical protein JRF57_16320 [Deltaproteobacteria bacterium]|nr:hypothetical protein [Deltaproteobacteria bacterium]MBW2305262.1 hypothetical protein [Deltaproteobacteria bacterium]